MHSLVALVVALTLLAAAPSFAEYAASDREASGWERAERFGRSAFDLTILRPLQLGQVVFSAAAFLAAYPVAYPFGGGEDVIDLCITEPWERIRRPLGEL